MVKSVFILLVFVANATLWAQTALFNAGDMTIHENAQIGFFSDIINEGNLTADNNTLVGLYGFESQAVQSESSLSVYDVEFGALFSTITLLTRMDVRNNANFISGNVAIPLTTSVDQVLNFEENAFYTGVNDESLVLGFAGMNGQTEFTFPIGDFGQLRPLILNTSDTGVIASSTYIREDPSNPTTYNENFDINSKARDIGEISSNEFWVLRSESEVRVSLTWNFQSNLSTLVNDVEQIVLVGWNIAANQWVPLGETTGNGTLEEGIISSSSFVPNRYGAITFGTIPLPLDTFITNNPTLGNYFVSPNADGTNDFLVFDNLEETGTNQVLIYNKFGQKVFEMTNYTNQFNGISNIDNFVLNREIGLPEGIYYYTILLTDLNLSYQGFLFLDR